MVCHLKDLVRSNKRMILSPRQPFFPIIKYSGSPDIISNLQHRFAV
ncbi:MAG: hypothetical protein ACI9JN_002260 [Bacteroidia bacterium]|jgi:hypothetical protein